MMRSQVTPPTNQGAGTGRLNIGQNSQSNPTNRSMFSVLSRRVAKSLHSEADSLPIRTKFQPNSYLLSQPAKTEKPNVKQADSSTNGRMSRLAIRAAVIAAAIFKPGLGYCVDQINLRGTRQNAQKGALIGDLTITTELGKPRGKVIKQFDSAHNTKLVQSASGQSVYSKNVRSQMNTDSTARSLPLLNMMRNVAIMEALGIKYPKAQINIDSDDLELFVEEMPDFETMHDMANRGLAASESLNPENRALYIAAIMLIDDLQDQNVGLQNGKDLAIIDYDSAYNTYFDNLFQPFSNLYYVFGNNYLKIKPTKADLLAAHQVLQDLLANSGQLESDFKKIYPLSKAEQGVDPFNDFVESTLDKMDCMRELVKLSDKDTIDVPTLGCLSMKIKEELKQKSRADNHFYQRSDTQLMQTLSKMRNQPPQNGVPERCAAHNIMEAREIELPDGAVWALENLFTPQDPSTFVEAKNLGQSTQPMETQLAGQTDLQTEWVYGTHIFKAQVSKDKAIDVYVNPKVGNTQEIQTLVERYAKIIGQFPAFIQNGVDKIYVQQEGGDPYSANGYEHSILIYQSAFDQLFNGDKTQNIEEALFYLCAQAAIDVASKTFPEYEKAIKQDGQALTKHAEQSSTRSDLIESLPFIYAKLKNPSRLSAETKALIDKVPHRVEYIKKHILNLSDLRGAKV